MREFLMNVDYPSASMYFSYAVCNFLLSGFFGGSETAFLSLNRIILYAKKKKVSAKLLIFLVERSSIFLTGIVVLNNVTLILSTLFVSKMFVESFHISILWAPLFTTLVMTPSVLIFAEVLPKSLSRPFADVLAYKFVYVWIVIFFLMYPIALFFKGITSIFAYLGGFYGKEESGFVKSEFQALLDISLKSGALNMGEREFINNILKFREIQASEVMTPLSQIVCIEKTQTVEQALTLMKEKEISIMPMYNARIDDPIGRVRAKDLINAHKDDLVEKYVQEAFFVPETAFVEKILIQMQRQNLPVAFVVDEYGGIVGVLRVEDIVVAIVGDVIEDRGLDIKTEDDGSIIAHGLSDIDELFEFLNLTPNIHLESKTLSGFIMEKLGRMPQEGDNISLKPWNFQVLSLQGHSVKKVHIKKLIKNKNNVAI
ncbi:MAG: hemolysin family protein [Brevinema sp.]